MKNILISLIGKGRTSENILKGYVKTKYRFRTGEIFETGFFGSALWKYVSHKEKIDHWYIFGTTKSSWSEIIYALEESKRNNFYHLSYEVYEAEITGIAENLLKTWEDALSSEIPGIKLILIDPFNYEFFSEFLLKNLPDEDLKIILDITHGYRYLPLILSFSLMYVKNFKSIKELKIYYGALEMSENNEAPVLEIDHINELFQISTAFELYRNSGYFSELLKNLGIHGKENLYFMIEMNLRPRKELKEVIESLKKVEKEYKKICAESLIKDLTPLYSEEYLEDRMTKRAEFFFEKKQYLKSLILLYEALTIIILKKAGYGDLTKIENRRQKVKEVYIKVLPEDWMREIFDNLERVRNSSVHGNIRETQSIIRNFEDFNDLFKESLKLFYHIRKTLN
ncbi:TIGR02221 family CRISPR-associated protein [Dictyoglomus sp.]|uniref:TIGR02221 family CRISPR-associated protein n=1 Tax=Dictyoglomus sp. TaxID=28205 RepID=UPI003D120754